MIGNSRPRRRDPGTAAHVPLTHPLTHLDLGRGLRDNPWIMKLKTLVGTGHRVMGLFLPFAVLGIVLNVVFPSWFAMGLGTAGVVTGIVLLIVGVPIWLVSVAQILIYVPRGKLITTGPFAIMLHPLYTSVALLVIPGVGFLLDTWLGPALGVVLYVSSRIFSPGEERILEKIFSEDYPVYRKRVFFPWL